MTVNQKCNLTDIYSHITKFVLNYTLRGLVYYSIIIDLELQTLCMSARIQGRLL